MSEIAFHQFDSVGALNEAVAALLKHQLETEYPCPHAVMLSGGKTPLEAYHLLAQKSCTVSFSARVLFSDERLVPSSSPESNYGNARFLMEALTLDDKQIIRVNADLNPKEAADDYDRSIRKFINGGGRISLGLLGLGADGHTAALFKRDDLELGRGRYAVATTAPDGRQRISVSPDLLAAVRRVIFVVSGVEKKAIVARLISCSPQTVAGLAVAGVGRKQVWFAGEGQAK